MDEPRLFCNGCRQHTRHEHRWGPHSAVADKSEAVPEDPIYDLWIYDLYTCLGCDRACLRIGLLPATDEPRLGSASPVDKRLIWTTHHPPRQYEQHLERSYTNLPEVLEKTYSELVLAYNSGSYTLCTAGIRMLMEGICNDRGIRGEYEEKPDGTVVLHPGLLRKLDQLAEKVPSDLKAGLRVLKKVAERAIHALRPADKATLGRALDVLEGLLDAFYELEYRSSLLEEDEGGLRWERRDIRGP